VNSFSWEKSLLSCLLAFYRCQEAIFRQKTCSSVDFFAAIAVFKLFLCVLLYHPLFSLSTFLPMPPIFYEKLIDLSLFNFPFH